MTKLRLEKFQGETDFSLFASLAYDEKVMKLNYGRTFTKEEADLFYQGILQANKKDAVLGYYKVYKMPEEGAGPFIGMCGMNLNSNFNGVEIEYMLLPAWWHQGLGTVLVKKLIQTIKNSGKYKCIIGITDPANTYSRKILQKTGFVSAKNYTIDDGSAAEVFRLDLG